MREKYKHTWAASQSAFMEISRLVWQIVQYTTCILSIQENQAMIKVDKMISRQIHTLDNSQTRFAYLNNYKDKIGGKHTWIA